MIPNRAMATQPHFPLLLVPGLGRSPREMTPLVRGTDAALHPVKLFPGQAQDRGFRPFAQYIEEAAARHQARAAVAESFGASALLHVLARQPGCFSHAVLVAPFAFDRPRLDRRESFQVLADACDRFDVDAIAGCLLDALPRSIPRDRLTRAWAGGTARRFLHPQVRQVLTWLPFHQPAPSGAADLGVRLLVLSQPDDLDHPIDVARRIVAAFPQAQLKVMPEPGDLLFKRHLIAGLVADFFAAAKHVRDGRGGAPRPACSSFPQLQKPL